MHPSGTRVAMVWDSLGLVAYEDRPEGLMSHLHIAFSPADTPERPSQASQCVIEINGGMVTAETTELILPLYGATPISVDYGKHIDSKTDAYFISFLFRRRASSRAGELLLGALTASRFRGGRPGFRVLCWSGFLDELGRPFRGMAPAKHLMLMASRLVRIGIGFLSSLVGSFWMAEVPTDE